MMIQKDSSGQLSIHFPTHTLCHLEEFSLFLKEGYWPLESVGSFGYSNAPLPVLGLPLGEHINAGGYFNQLFGLALRLLILWT